MKVAIVRHTPRPYVEVKRHSVQCTLCKSNKGENMPCYSLGNSGDGRGLTASVILPDVSHGVGVAQRFLSDDRTPHVSAAAFMVKKRAALYVGKGRAVMARSQG